MDPAKIGVDRRASPVPTCWTMGRWMFSRLLILYALVFCFAFSGSFSDSDFDKARRLQEMGRYPEAERLYRAVLAVDPDSVPALTNLGGVLSRQEKHSAAIA